MWLSVHTQSLGYLVTICLHFSCCGICKKTIFAVKMEHDKIPLGSQVEKSLLIHSFCSSPCVECLPWSHHQVLEYGSTAKELPVHISASAAVNGQVVCLQKKWARTVSWLLHKHPSIPCGYKRCFLVPHFKYYLPISASLRFLLKPQFMRSFCGNFT